MINLRYSHVFETPRDSSKYLKPRMFPVIRSTVAQVRNQNKETDGEHRSQRAYEKERFSPLRPSSSSKVTDISDEVEEKECGETDGSVECTPTNVSECAEENKVGGIACAEARDAHETWYLTHGDINCAASHKCSDGCIIHR